MIRIFASSFLLFFSVNSFATESCDDLTQTQSGVGPFAKAFCLAAQGDYSKCNQLRVEAFEHQCKAAAKGSTSACNSIDTADKTGIATCKVFAGSGSCSFSANTTDDRQNLSWCKAYDLKKSSECLGLGRIGLADDCKNLIGKLEAIHREAEQAQRGPTEEREAVSETTDDLTRAPVVRVAPDLMPSRLSDVEAVDLESSPVKAQLRTLVKYKSRDDGFSGGLSQRLSDSRVKMAEVSEQLNGSPVGRELLGSMLSMIKSEDETVDLVMSPGVGGQFLMPGDPTTTDPALLTQPTIAWDPNHGTVILYDIEVGTNVTARSYEYPPWLTLLHELGHLKQFKDDHVLSGEDAQSYVALVRGAGISGSEDGGHGVAAIEADNLRKHENPAARAAGLPVREHYDHTPESRLWNKWLSDGKTITITDGPHQGTYN